MRVFIVNTVEGFNNVYNEFAVSAKICEAPRIQHIGIDTEYISRDNYRESFDTIDNQWSGSKVKICTIQMSTQTVTIILKVFDIVYLPSKLVEIFQSPSWIKTGIGINLDCKYIRENFGISHIEGVMDITTFEHMMGNSAPNMEALIHIATGRTHRKVNKIIDWTINMSGNFIDRQLEYLICDGYYSYALGRKFIPCYHDDCSPLPDYETEVIDINENYIGRLEEFCSKHLLIFESNITNCTDSFTCIVRVKDKVFTSSPHTNKKFAKQESYKKCLKFLVATYLEHNMSSSLSDVI